MQNVIQVPSSDGCIYIYNLEAGKIQKLCDVLPADKVPQDVSENLARFQKDLARYGG